MTDHGTYLEHEGRPAVRFIRRYPHPAERVWAAVSEPAGLRHWFPSTVELEPRAGGRIAFHDDPNLPAPSGPSSPTTRRGSWRSPGAATSCTSRSTRTVTRPAR